jgi:hypothetical protein
VSNPTTPDFGGSVPVDQTGSANNATRTDSTEKAMSVGEAHQKAIDQTFEGANPTTEAKNTLVDKQAGSNQEGVPEGQTKLPDPKDRTVAAVASDGRVGPGTGDGVDTRPLGDPSAPQGTGPEVPGQATPPVHLRPAPAGEIRVSHAESGDYSK